MNLQTRKRFWLDQGFSGYASTDLPVMGVMGSIAQEVLEAV